jgi:hypothetical protein
MPSLFLELLNLRKTTRGRLQVHLMGAPPAQKRARPMAVQMIAAAIAPTAEVPPPHEAADFGPPKLDARPIAHRIPLFRGLGAGQRLRLMHRFVDMAVPA